MNQLFVLIPCFIIILALMATVAWLLDKVNCMADDREDKRAGQAAGGVVKGEKTINLEHWLVMPGRQQGKTLPFMNVVTKFENYKAKDGQRVRCGYCGQIFISIGDTKEYEHDLNKCEQSMVHITCRANINHANNGNTEVISNAYHKWLHNRPFNLEGIKKAAQKLKDVTTNKLTKRKKFRWKNYYRAKKLCRSGQQISIGR
ncbi:hypothetical protein [Sporomusa sp. KB1]|jgi:hypothetical protein|uniref:hypothetical protein n=1 Tax=Sporomusa sp. KB1 TaxID=943346 RepID=UPI0011A6D6F6|nr:hypothetical protein [Sporomusa sp. KB1]TWH49609.1 hypothetical protein Salpa_5848 [Sporomusa sp. KB1]